MGSPGNLGRVGRPLGGANSAPWFTAAALAAIDGADSGVKLPGLIADFRAGRTSITTVPTGSIAAATAAQVGVMAPCQFSDIFTFTRSSVKNVINSSGAYVSIAVDAVPYDYTNGVQQLLLEGAATNVFLNSAVGGTQSVTTTAVAYVLSFYGTGSITCSGTSTTVLNGTGANNRVQATFTPTAGTLTLTVSGSITNVQLETGVVASSYITTTGAAVTRAADVCQLSAKALAVLARTAAAVTVQGRGLSGTLGRMVGGAAGSIVMSINAAQTAMRGGTTSFINWGSFTAPMPAHGNTLGWNGSGKSGSYNGSTIVTDAVAMDATLSSAFLGNDSGGTSPANGWYDRLIVYPFKPTDASIVSKAAAYT